MISWVWGRVVSGFGGCRELKTKTTVRFHIEKNESQDADTTYTRLLLQTAGMLAKTIIPNSFRAYMHG